MGLHLCRDTQRSAVSESPKNSRDKLINTIQRRLTVNISYWCSFVVFGLLSFIFVLPPNDGEIKLYRPILTTAHDVEGTEDTKRWTSFRTLDCHFKGRCFRDVSFDLSPTVSSPCISLDKICHFLCIFHI